jgi:hypothetical protein
MDRDDRFNSQSSATVRPLPLSDSDATPTGNQSEAAEGEAERLYVREIRKGKDGRPKLMIDFTPA